MVDRIFLGLVLGVILGYVESQPSSLFVMPEVNRFVGFDLCVANVQSVEETARDQSMSKEELVEYMVERCKLEYEAVFVEGGENESERPLNYCDVVEPNYRPQGFGSLKVSSRLCDKIKDAMRSHNTGEKLEKKAIESVEEKFVQQAVSDDRIVVDDDEGCCLGDEEVVEKLKSLEETTWRLEKNLSRTHDLLHRSEHKWPEKALVRRIQLLTEQLELAAETRESYVNSLTMSKKYRDMEKKLKFSPQNVSLATELASMKGELHGLQVEAKLKYAILRHRNLASRRDVTQAQIDAAKANVEKIELELVEAKRNAQSKAMAAVLRAEADAVTQQVNSLQDYTRNSEKRLALRARSAQLMHTAEKLQTDTSSQERLLRLLAEAEEDAKKHPKDEVAKLRADRLRKGVDARALQTLKLLKVLEEGNESQESEDCADCVVRVIGVMESAITQGVRGTILGSYMETFCERALENVPQKIPKSEYDKKLKTCSRFRDEIVSGKNDTRSMNAILSFCKVSRSCGNSEDVVSKKSGQCERCASEIIGGVQLLRQKSSSDPDKPPTLSRRGALSQVCTHRLRQRWVTHLSVIRSTCKAATDSFSKLPAGPAEELHQSFELCHSMGECTSREVQHYVGSLDDESAMKQKGQLELDAGQHLENLKTLYGEYEDAKKKVRDAKKKVAEIKGECDDVNGELGGFTKELNKKKSAVHDKEASLAKMRQRVREAQQNATNADEARIAAEMSIQAIENAEAARVADIKEALESTGRRVQQQRDVSKARVAKTVSRVNEKMLGMSKAALSSEERRMEEGKLAEEAKRVMARDAQIQNALDAQLEKQKKDNATAFELYVKSHNEAQISLERVTKISKELLETYEKLSDELEESLAKLSEVQKPLKDISGRAKAKLQQLQECENRLMSSRASWEASQNAVEVAAQHVMSTAGEGSTPEEAIEIAKRKHASVSDMDITEEKPEIVIPMILISHNSDKVKITDAISSDLVKQLAHAMDVTPECVRMSEFLTASEEKQEEVRFEMRVCEDVDRPASQIRNALRQSDLFVRPETNNLLPTFAGMQFELCFDDDGKDEKKENRQSRSISIDECAKRVVDILTSKSDYPEKIETQLKLMCIGELSSRLGPKGDTVMKSSIRDHIHKSCESSSQTALKDYTSAQGSSLLDRSENFCIHMNEEVSGNEKEEVLKSSNTSSQPFTLPIVNMGNMYAWSNGGMSFYSANVLESQERNSVTSVTTPEMLTSMETQYKKQWRSKLGRMRKMIMSTYKLRRRKRK